MLEEEKTKEINLQEVFLSARDKGIASNSFNENAVDQPNHTEDIQGNDFERDGIIAVPVNESSTEIEDDKKNKYVSKTKNKATKAPSYEHFNVLCDKDLACKIRLIAEKERFSIREIVEQIFKQAIERYESLHGVIRKPRKNSITDLF